MSYILSICMIVKNEEKNLTRCLESIKPILDNGIAELIVVDTGSMDNSVEIIKKYTNNIYTCEWNDDFAEMRNTSISYANGEWIFILDADEVVNNVHEIINLFTKNLLYNYNTVSIKIKNHMTKSIEKITTCTLLRIFKNSKEFKYSGIIHEQPNFKFPILFTDILINHYGYDWDNKELKYKKFDRTVKLLKKAIQNEPLNTYYQYQLAVTWFNVDLFVSLLEIRKAYNIIKNEESKIMYKNLFIFGLYSRAAFENKRYLEAISIAKEGIKLSSDYIDLLYSLTLSYFSLTNSKECILYGERYLKCRETFYSKNISNDPSLTFYHLDESSYEKILYVIADSYIEIGLFDKAYLYIEKIDTMGLQISLIKKICEYEKSNKLLLDYIDLNFIDQKRRNILINIIENSSTYIKHLLSPLHIISIYLNNNYIKDNYYYLNYLRENKYIDLGIMIEIIDKNNNLEPYYGDIVNYIIDGKLDIKYLTMLNEKKMLEEMIIFIDMNGIVSNKAVLDYIQKYKDVENVYDIKTWMVLAKYILDEDKINKNELISVFKLYINNGKKYISSVYKDEIICEDEIGLLESNEHRFIFIMHEAFTCEDDNIKKYLSLLKKSLKEKLYENIIKIMLEEIKLKFNLENNYRDKLNKDNIKAEIKRLIETGKINEANQKIINYRDLFRNDIELYSIEGVLKMLLGENEHAEKIFMDGLAHNKFDFDLLFNLGYLYESNNQNNNAIHFYGEALNNATTSELANIANEKLLKFKSKKSIERIQSELNNEKTNFLTNFYEIDKRKLLLDMKINSSYLKKKYNIKI